MFLTIELLSYFITETEVKQSYHPDITSIMTPVKVNVLEKMLVDAEYDEAETQYLINGFRYGFDLEYEGAQNRQDTSCNIPFTVGKKFELWNKIMKEVEAERFAGPFESIPFTNFVQSPIGLVPKAGNQTRLIFHLSYHFKDSGNRSVNECTPKE